MAHDGNCLGTLKSVRILVAAFIAAIPFATISCASDEGEAPTDVPAAVDSGGQPDANTPDADAGSVAYQDGSAEDAREAGSPDAATAPDAAADADVDLDAAATIDGEPDADLDAQSDAQSDAARDAGAISDASVRPDVVYVFPDDYADAALDPDGMAAEDAQVAWKHWNYTMNPDHTIQDYGTTQRSIVDQTINAVVLENDWVKVTLMPEFGGRIASILYKPTGHEELYRNPVGSPWGYRSGAFYYNWLMVYGGIFPTLPEPEHGKTWILSWASTVVERTADRIAVRMSITDDIDPPSGTPKKFVYGKTGLKVNATVTLYRDRSSVDFAIDLMNPAPDTVTYEYWTCATMTPGSVPGNTFSPANSEIIAPISQAEIGMGNWPGSSGGRIAWGPSVSFFDKWQNMGILYAYPSMQKNFWGVINHNNKEGILRIADNSMTPGMKMWTWGYTQSLNVDPTLPANADNGARPYFELWGGVSHKFFDPATIGPGGRKRWTETYLVTSGLDAVTAASLDGAAYLQTATVGTDLVLTADLFTAHPGMDVTGTVLIDDVAAAGDIILKADAVTPSRFQVTKALSAIAAGAHTFTFVAKGPGGSTLLSASTAFTR